MKIEINGKEYIGLPTAIDLLGGPPKFYALVDMGLISAPTKLGFTSVCEKSQIEEIAAKTKRSHKKTEG